MQRTSIIHVLYLLVFFGALTKAVPIAEEISANEMQDMIDYRKALIFLQQVLSNAQQTPTANRSPLRKRTCYFNAGLSHNCDYKELVGAVDEANYWSSELTPGRRRRRSPTSTIRRNTENVQP